MTTVDPSGISVGARRTATLVVGFGTAVTMWGVGYTGRLPAVNLSSQALFGALIVAVVLGGVVLGRYTGAGWRLGSMAGLVCGALNLLVLGSFLSSEDSRGVTSGALVWVPGFLIVSALLCAVGAAIGARWVRRAQPHTEWTPSFLWVAVAAALLLMAAGGVVTSTGTGLAVVDWPNTFGYNMFLYPFSRMTGGIYYEHAHRLLGALVGLTTLVAAALLQATEERAWVRRLGWLAVVIVAIQGVLGGLRVTGRMTLSTSPDAMQPSLLLAMVHGVLAQLFLGLLVALAAFSSGTWRSRAPATVRATAGADRMMGVALLALLILQLILGAAHRHFGRLLLAHLAVGVLVAAPLAIHVGLRAWGGYPDQPVLRRLGRYLVAAVTLQVILGFGAFAASGALASGSLGPTPEILATTVHQWFGAVLFGLAVLVATFQFRLTAISPFSR
jgi:cytochrome c oxidase assembly protein subunit 15